MVRNKHPRVAFHLPQLEVDLLKAQTPEGKTLSDLLRSIVRTHLNRTDGNKTTKALALRIALENLLQEVV